MNSCSGSSFRLKTYTLDFTFDFMATMRYLDLDVATCWQIYLVSKGYLVSL